MNIFGYAASVTSVALIITVSQSLLPDGKCKNAVKIVFRFLLIITVVNPLLKSNFNVNFSFDSAEVAIDDEAVSYIEQEKISIIEIKCEEILNKEGIFVKEVEITAYRHEGKYFIEKVTVILDEKRITDETEHINITSKTKSLLSDLLSVDKGVITVESR